MLDEYPSVETQASTHWIDFDETRLARDYNKRPFAFSHRLASSPLFELPRLADLAERLFAIGGKRDIYNAPAGEAPGELLGKNGGRGLSPAEAVRTIESSASWVALKRVEQIPEYREIVESCVAQLAACVPAFDTRHVEKAEGFIFVSSPRAVTPYHIDPQWAFIAQTRGEKTYRIYDVNDRAVISEAEIEELCAGDFNAALYHPSKDARAESFVMRPGDGVMQPVYAPHTAAVGDSYSVSFSVALVSDVWSNLIPLRLANRRLRAAGFNPTRIGENIVLDAVKSLAFRAAARAAKIAAPVLKGEASASYMSAFTTIASAS